MTRKSLFIVIGYALGVIGFAAPTPVPAADQGTVEQEVMQLERRWCSATLAGDVAAVNEILADDYTDVVLNTGAIAYKAQTLAELKPHKATVCEVDMLQVRVYGDAAIVIGRATEKSARFVGQYRYTDTYIRRDGHWRCVASQSTAIKP